MLVVFEDQIIQIKTNKQKSTNIARLYETRLYSAHYNQVLCVLLGFLTLNKHVYVEYMLIRHQANNCRFARFIAVECIEFW